MNKIFASLFIALACWAPLLAQQEARQMTLQEAIDYALSESIEIKNARITIADARQQIIERRAYGLPQLSAGASYQHYIQVPRQPLPEGFDIFNIFGQALAVDLYDELSEDTQRAIDEAFAGSNGGGSSEGIAFFLKNNFAASLNLDAMIFDPSFFVGLEAAREYKEYTEREFATKKREVAKSVIDAYLPVLLLQENITILDRNIDNLGKFLFETRELYKAGFAEQLDIDRQELSMANLQTERENLVRQKEKALSLLKYTMGYPADEPLVVADKLERLASEAAELDMEDGVQLARRPEYGLLDQAIKMNELNIKLNRSGYLPSLRAFGTYQQQYQGDDFENGFWAPSTVIGLSLNVPIFDGLERKAKIERARLDLEKARNEQENLARAINLEVSTARSDLAINQRRLEYQARNLSLAERIYETTQIKYREGVGSSVEVIQAEQALYTSQSNYIQSLYDLLLSKSNLELALGLE